MLKETAKLACRKMLEDSQFLSIKTKKYINAELFSTFVRSHKKALASAHAC